MGNYLSKNGLSYLLPKLKTKLGGGGGLPSVKIKASSKDDASVVIYPFVFIDQPKGNFYWSGLYIGACSTHYTTLPGVYLIMISHNDTTGFQHKIIEIVPDNNEMQAGFRGGKFGYAFDGDDETYYWLAMRKADNAENGIIYQLEKDDPNDLISFRGSVSFMGDWSSTITVDSIWTP